MRVVLCSQTPSYGICGCFITRLDHDVFVISLLLDTGCFWLGVLMNRADQNVPVLVDIASFHVCDSGARLPGPAAFMCLVWEILAKHFPTVSDAPYCAPASLA